MGFGGPSTWRSLRLLALPALFVSILLISYCAGSRAGDQAAVVVQHE